MCSNIKAGGLHVGGRNDQKLVTQTKKLINIQAKNATENRKKSNIINLSQIMNIMNV